MGRSKTDIYKKEIFKGVPSKKKIELVNYYKAYLLYYPQQLLWYQIKTDINILDQGYDR